MPSLMPKIACAKSVFENYHYCAFLKETMLHQYFRGATRASRKNYIYPSSTPCTPEVQGHVVLAEP
jgi:hypothetical protein